LKNSVPSLSWRLVSRVVLASFVAVLVALAWLYWKNYSVQGLLRDRTLVAQAEDIGQHVSLRSDGGVRLKLPARLEEAYNEDSGAYHYAVRDAAGELLMSSAARMGPVPHIGRQNFAVYDYDPKAGGPRVFGAAATVQIDDRSFVVQVEQSHPGPDSLSAKVTHEFLTDGGWLCVPFLIALLAISAVTVRRTLTPLRQLSIVATQLGPANADLRFPEGDIPREVLPLVRAINSALDRLEAGFRQQSEFTSNAAHQLRTPLAVLAANIDLIPDQAISTSLRGDLDAMSRLVTQLLLVARLEASAVDWEQMVDLGEVARETVISLGPIAVTAGKTIAVDADDVRALVRGNPSLIRGALENIVENAIVHTPKGTSVLIRVRRGMHIDVTDTGPGIPEEFRDKIFERFWRGEHSQSGAGLGLSIARRVMDLLGGTVSVFEPPEGGTVFSLKFVSGVEETIRSHPAIMSDRDKTNDIETADWKFRVTG
jgi:signal transduction histidine kinase